MQLYLHANLALYRPCLKEKPSEMQWSKFDAHEAILLFFGHVLHVLVLYYADVLKQYGHTLQFALCGGGNVLCMCVCTCLQQMIIKANSQQKI